MAKPTAINTQKMEEILAAQERKRLAKLADRAKTAKKVAPDQPATAAAVAPDQPKKRKSDYQNKGRYTLKAAKGRSFPTPDAVQDLISNLVPPYMANRKR